ncbi:MAG: YggS family pyridoxal phosphate-dependent enzyme [Alphaproteobacteria bacterium]|nr:YggS family pyridoxal phosphate-dependent enzyme [Alphaproteobacteria bacterium]
MYQDIVSEIEFTVKKEGRNGADVNLVVVSKTFAADDIEPVLELGARIFGENRVQEAAAKWPELQAVYNDVKLHLIGPLQSNKTAEAVALFDVIHTVDRKKIADYIAAEQLKQDKLLELFIQVNIGDEPQKAGIALAELADFYRYCVDEKKLNIIGLMCIPPAAHDSGPYFALLHKHAKALGLKGLSMGMSADFKTAIRLGATHIRVGSAIFGSRD